ncbi:hypothetical protein H4R35_004756, partial [Dimargaris xerosporica]
DNMKTVRVLFVGVAALAVATSVAAAPLPQSETSSNLSDILMAAVKHLGADGKSAVDQPSTVSKDPTDFLTEQSTTSSTKASQPTDQSVHSEIDEDSSLKGLNSSDKPKALRGLGDFDDPVAELEQIIETSALSPTEKSSMLASVAEVKASLSNNASIDQPDSLTIASKEDPNVESISKVLSELTGNKDEYKPLVQLASDAVAKYFASNARS